MAGVRLFVHSTVSLTACPLTQTLAKNLIKKLAKKKQFQPLDFLTKTALFHSYNW